MAIKYVSTHDSPEDPGGLIKDVLDMGAEFLGPAEDILVAWMLRLGEDRDPAEAARHLLDRYGIAEGPLPDGACGRVIELLRQTADFPQDRLTSHLGRRSGRARRRDR
jgi:hypothetical protein